MIFDSISTEDLLRAGSRASLLALVLGSVTLAAYYIVPYLANKGKLNDIPGPLVAKFSNLWSLYWARQHQLSWVTYDLHKELGDFVRLAPDHVSISHPDSIRDVMGHGNGFTKSEFYYAFDNIQSGIFTTRDRAAHSRKRKYVSHMFSPKAMVGFEPYMTSAIGTLATQMNSLIDTGRANRYTALGAVDPEIKARQQQGEAALDVAQWSAFLAFDIIGDLAFGEPFGFTAMGQDTNGGIKKLRDRGEWCATVGQMPWIKTWTPYFFFDSFFIKGLQATKDLAAIGIAKVEKRKMASRDASRRDILYYLLSATDPDTGGDLPDREIKAEALTQLIAGSDTTGNTITHLVDMLARHPEALKTLQAELDAAFPNVDQDFVAMFEDCKDLPYTQGVINETLRLRTTVSVGLPRVVPKGGAMACGRFFEEGTTLSTPTYTVHRDSRVWGPDAQEFKPERWRREGAADLEKAFLGFSYGPRACIGRNVAYMELKKTVATLFRLFEYRVVFPEKESHIREGFHLKCQELPVFVRRRTPVSKGTHGSVTLS
ncbi:hypothetical protein LTR10_019970 [Elasticomyces elasticus]|uniref:Uncharacterized protein n=1 Tax=Exophiala sideris TaxID=1016849 RepID=A0ABR0IY91_9EURO|nr:hypothetical protein LTR10_019970 [Elasticomyces elasticus]KAK5022435.1 hypothetical protein LTS07_010095 [Exophiala sideris]KAK5051289.1 hypothetical protein LTR69_010315 [Exophiala sideris]